MPYPLAHPAAVLLLRCCRAPWLDFPALVIGSLAPDLGYAFGRLHLASFSHRPLAGSLVFCVPVGLLALPLFRLLRPQIVALLPPRHRHALRPLAPRSATAPFGSVVSLFVGAWTHNFLDSLTRPSGWVFEHLPILRTRLVKEENLALICDLLYGAFTFAGALYVGVAYLNRIEKGAGNPGWMLPGYKWSSSVLFATSTLLLAAINHQMIFPLGPAPVAGLTLMLALVFFLAPGWTLRDRSGPVDQCEIAGKPEAPVAELTE